MTLRRIRGWLRRWSCRIGALVVCVIVIAGAWVALRDSLVVPERLVRYRDGLVVVDRHGNDLRHVRVDGMDRRWVELREVSPQLVQAVVAAEDGRFWEHGGVDGVAMLRAGLTALVPGTKCSGASTISQQLVKLLYGRPRGLLSKGLEVLRALALERMLTKREILEQYLNRVSFGDQIQGVGRASEEYFGHPVSTLSLGEAALLAGIPQAPSINEPRRHSVRAQRRRNYVLDRMLAEGMIQREQWKAARNDRLRVAAKKRRPWHAPRFVDHALEQWRAGKEWARNGRLTTSLDLALHEELRRKIADALRKVESRGGKNGAGLALDNESGEILAYVGAAKRGVHAPGGQMDLLRRKRQPGSTLKPFAYELLFERGGHPAVLLEDVNRPMTGHRGEHFVARDYDGVEKGPVRARVGLASSLNLAALDVARKVGPDAIIRRLEVLGMELGGDAKKYGAAVVLGGADVAGVELARAYVSLARLGTGVELSPFPRGAQRGARVMSLDAASMTVDVLSDPKARADGFGDDLVGLAETQHFALKTGTSSGWRDAWAVAFDSHHTVLVWIGDPSGRSMGEVSGFEAAAPAATRALARARALRRLPNTTSRSASLVPIRICSVSGLRPAAHCPHTIVERFTDESIPGRVCTMHGPGGVLSLPSRYTDWIAQTRAPRTFASEKSTWTGPVVVTSPKQGARYVLDRRRVPASIALRPVRDGAEVDGVIWVIDGNEQSEARWTLRAGTHVVEARTRGRASPRNRFEVLSY